MSGRFKTYEKSQSKAAAAGSFVVTTTVIMATARGLW